MRIACAEINLSALKANFHAVQKCAPNSKVIAILKANAYGHGMTKIAHALHDADMFGVARVEEAFMLRSSGITNPILLLEGFFNNSELPLLAASNIHTVIHNDKQLADLEGSSHIAAVNVWLKVDTGMHRLGIDPEQFDDFYRRLHALPNVQKPIHIMSHFGCADEPLHPLNAKQLACFNALNSNGELRSIANSAAAIALPESQLDFVRPGLMLYGVPPLKNADNIPCELTPIMTLKTSVISVKRIKKGESVGYGGRWVAERDKTIAIAGIGYGDGYPRQLPDGAPVLVNGQRYPLAGAVSMDMINIDIGDNERIAVGDEVILWGQDLSVNEVAEYANTIGYELLCNVTRRVKFRYFD